MGPKHLPGRGVNITDEIRALFEGSAPSPTLEEDILAAYEQLGGAANDCNGQSMIRR